MKFDWAKTWVRNEKVTVDVVELIQRGQAGYRTLSVDASVLGIAIVERIAELSKDILDLNKTIMEQDRMIIALKAELGQIALQAEGENEE